MDIHKPKPWHSLREFLKEYVIIVVGVLTALAAEQGVEWLHWSQKVEAGRAAVRAELATAANDAEERVLMRDCWERRVSYLQDQLDSAHGVWPGRPWALLADTPQGFARGEAYGSTIRNWNSEVWRGLVADGTAVHFPRSEMLGYARIYHFVDVLQAENQQEWQQLARVAVLGRPLRLSDPAAYETAVALEDARRKNRLMALGASQLLGQLDGARAMPTSARYRDRIADLHARAARCLADPTGAG